jgi:hypothetical protein
MQPLKNAPLCSSNTRVLALHIVTCSDFTMQPSRICQKLAIWLAYLRVEVFGLFIVQKLVQDVVVLYKRVKTFKLCTAGIVPYSTALRGGSIMVFLPVFADLTLFKSGYGSESNPIKGDQTNRLQQGTPQAVPEPEICLNCFQIRWISKKYITKHFQYQNFQERSF